MLSQAPRSGDDFWRLPFEFLLHEALLPLSPSKRIRHESKLLTLDGQLPIRGATKVRTATLNRNLKQLP